MASKYDRIIYGTNPETGEASSVVVDVYRVVDAFGVKSGAMSHLIKKALCTGLRGHKDEEQDLIDILHSAETALAQYYERNPKTSVSSPEPKVAPSKQFDAATDSDEAKPGFSVHYHFHIPEGGPSILKHNLERIGDCIASSVNIEAVTSRADKAAKTFAEDLRPAHAAPRHPEVHSGAPVIMGTDFAVDPDVVHGKAKTLKTGTITGQPVPYTPAIPIGEGEPARPFDRILGVHVPAPAPAPAPEPDETPEEEEMRLHCERMAEEEYIADLRRQEEAEEAEEAEAVSLEAEPIQWPDPLFDDEEPVSK